LSTTGTVACFRRMFATTITSARMRRPMIEKKIAGGM
jgi:hypothetical protein